MFYLFEKMELGPRQAGDEFFQHFLVNILFFLTGVHDEDPVLFPAGYLQEDLPDLFMELEFFTLHTIFAPAPFPGPLQARFHWQVEKNGQVRL